MILSVYTAPMSTKPFRCWRQKSSKYRYGFVLRILWLGIVFRFGHRDAADDFEDVS